MAPSNFSDTSATVPVARISRASSRSLPRLGFANEAVAKQKLKKIAPKKKNRMNFMLILS